MPQIRHFQRGIFHVTTNAQDNVRWCTSCNIPHILIRHLCRTRDEQNGKLYAFCILPNHIHMLLTPGEQGLSAFMQSFKSNAMKDIRQYLQSDGFIDCDRPPGRGVPAAPYSLHGQIICWQNGFYDNLIRTNKQCSSALYYVQGNAMKHHLVNEITDWPWTSLHFPKLLHPMELWGN